MSTPPATEQRPVLLVGATGFLGGLTLRALRARGKVVRALVRPGSDVAGLPTQGVEIVRGDMLEPASLGPAMQGVSAVVSTAIGYSRRRPTDSLRTDTEGNAHVVEAARRAGVPRFVLLSILACDQARDVPHFWAKKETEDLLRAAGVPCVALRPGAFLGGPWMKAGLEHGQLAGMTPAGIRITYVAPSEVARALALAVDEPRALGQTVDLGCDRALSGPELAELVGRLLGRPIAAVSLPPTGNSDMDAMVAFFQTGKYVANTRRQAELFGPVPRVEDAAREMLSGYGLLPGGPGAPKGAGASPSRSAPSRP
jgi:uncharacterized protein YbjT (DUF2867 family)